MLLQTLNSRIEKLKAKFKRKHVFGCMVSVLAALLSAFLITINLAVPIATIQETIKYRLGDSVKPSQYDLELTPYILENEAPEGKARFTFDSKVAITLKADKDNIKEIVLHAKYLDINKDLTSLKRIKQDPPQDPIKITNLTLDEKTDKLTLTLDKALDKNEDYILSFVYTGEMKDDMKGFYKSYYLDENKTEVYLASTQFQIHHARRAFPCFDEPKFKAIFNIKINRHKSLIATSNTRIDHHEEVGDRVIDTFKTTPKMSTYLVAFLVSNFKRRGNAEGSFSVLARGSAFDHTEFSFDVGKRLLAKLDDFTGMAYLSLGNDKMDLAAIPDFNVGAMENWGLLTYRETALLLDPVNSTASAQESSAAVIAHEQAHMWFGNSVTCDWWSYTWLNEGFSRYFQYFATHWVFPKWEMDKQFVIQQVHTAMNFDSLIGTYPMSDTSVESPDDINRIFGTISYNKGASIIRMISHIMGEVAFKKAINEYLVENKFKTSTPDKLFNHLKANFKDQKVNFEKLLEDFTEQEGYPLVKVTLGKDGKELKVSQERFLLNPEDGSKKNILYTIPFTYVTNNNLEFSNTKPEVYIPKNDKESIINLKEAADFVIVNPQQTGYYRVQYDHDTWHKIEHALTEKNHGRIHEINRAQIIDDLINMDRAGYDKYDHTFHMLEYLLNEVNYLPWYTALKYFNYLYIRLGQKHSELFGKNILRLTKKVYKSVGFVESVRDTHLDIYNRELILRWSCKYSHEDCITKAKEHFKALKEGLDVPPNIRSVVYCTGIKEGNKDDFNFLKDRYEQVDLATEKTLILSALGCSKNKEIIEYYLNYILSNKMRPQVKTSALSAAYESNLDNVPIVFAYVTKEYKNFVTSLGYSSVASLLSSISTYFTTKEELKQLKDFYDSKKTEFGSAAKTLEKALDNVASNIKWSEEKLPPYVDFLKLKNGAAGRATLSITLIAMSVISLLILRLF